MVAEKYTITEIENLMPWERDVFVGMIIEKKQKQLEQNQNG